MGVHGTICFVIDYTEHENRFCLNSEVRANAMEKIIEIKRHRRSCSDFVSIGQRLLKIYLGPITHLIQIFGGTEEKRIDRDMLPKVISQYKNIGKKLSCSCA
jgi:hypothetical protein